MHLDKGLKMEGDGMGPQSQDCALLVLGYFP